MVEKGRFLKFTKEEFCKIPDFTSLETIAESLGVEKVVSITVLADSVFVFYEDSKEDLLKYYEIDKDFLIKDAEIRLDDYLGLEDPDNADAFGEEYGFEVMELFDKNSEHYILEILADDFVENKDCNVADNVTWENIISQELKNLKAEG